MSDAMLETVSAGSSCERILHLIILTTMGVDVPKSARILDFGCGSGSTVSALRTRGYVNAEGYDVVNYRGTTPLISDREHITNGTLLDLRLPYADNTFDLVISDQVFEHVQDQVRAFEELYRVTKPGGHGMHIIPARYMPIEGHIFVPFGGVFQHRWWYKLWAVLGVRNEYQKGLSADEAADHNTYFATEATRYISTSCYRVVWDKIGFDYRFVEQEFFDGHRRSSMRTIGKLRRPAVWLYRIFRSRVVYLHKPNDPT